MAEPSRRGARGADATRGPLADLRELLDAEGPFLSVLLALDPAVEHAGALSERHWAAVRTGVAERSAEGALAQVDPLIPTAHQHGGSIAVVATAEAVLHVEYDVPVAADVARWDALPSLASLVRRRQDAPPHLVVLADRRGADLHVVEIDHDRHRSIEGDDREPIRKVASGGWSQRRYQQRAENTWDHHARDLADEVAALADRVHAETVLVGGDVRAVQLLEEHLPDRVRALIEPLPGGRAADGSAEATATAVDRWVATAAARDTVETLERFREDRGRGDRAVDGSGASLAALAARQVDTLLVHDDEHDDRRAWFAPDIVPVAATRDALVELGVEAPIEGRLVDVAIAAALATDAGVRIVPRAGGPRGGLGAFLRWQ